MSNFSTRNPAEEHKQAAVADFGVKLPEQKDIGAASPAEVASSQNRSADWQNQGAEGSDREKGMGGRLDKAQVSSKGDWQNPAFRPRAHVADLIKESGYKGN